MLPQEICSNGAASNKVRTHGTRSRIAGALPSRRSRGVGRTLRSALRSGGAVRFPAFAGFFPRRQRGDLPGSFSVRHQKPGFLPGRKPVQTWLFRIAANKARDYREKRIAAKRGGGQTTISLQAENPETGLTPDAPDHLPAPDENLMNAEQLSLVRASLDQLTGPCREIIELRYFGDLSYEELSATLSLNAKTVSSRLSKCLDRLEEIARKIFSRENPDVFPSNG